MNGSNRIQLDDSSTLKCSYKKTPKEEKIYVLALAIFGLLITGVTITATVAFLGNIGGKTSPFYGKMGRLKVAAPLMAVGSLSILGLTAAAIYEFTKMHRLIAQKNTPATSLIAPKQGVSKHPSAPQPESRKLNTSRADSPILDSSRPENLDSNPSSSTYIPSIESEDKQRIDDLPSPISPLRVKFESSNTSNSSDAFSSSETEEEEALNIDSLRVKNLDPLPTIIRSASPVHVSSWSPNLVDFEDESDNGYTADSDLSDEEDSNHSIETQIISTSSSKKEAPLVFVPSSLQNIMPLPPCNLLSLNENTTSTPSISTFYAMDTQFTPTSISDSEDRIIEVSNNQSRAAVKTKTLSNYKEPTLSLTHVSNLSLDPEIFENESDDGYTADSDLSNRKDSNYSTETQVISLSSSSFSKKEAPLVFMPSSLQNIMSLPSFNLLSWNQKSPIMLSISIFYEMDILFTPTSISDSEERIIEVSNNQSRAAVKTVTLSKYKELTFSLTYVSKRSLHLLDFQNESDNGYTADSNFTDKKDSNYSTETQIISVSSSSFPEKELPLAFMPSSLQSIMPLSSYNLLSLNQKTTIMLSISTSYAKDTLFIFDSEDRIIEVSNNPSLTSLETFTLSNSEEQNLQQQASSLAKKFKQNRVGSYIPPFMKNRIVFLPDSPAYFNDVNKKGAARLEPFVSSSQFVPPFTRGKKIYLP